MHTHGLFRNRSLAFAPFAVATLCLGLASPALAQSEGEFRSIKLAGTVVAADITGLSYQARGCVTAVSDVAARTGVATQGQVLVELDDRSARLALSSAQARVADLQAAVAERELAIKAAMADGKRRAEEMTFVTREFDRSQTMFQRGLINETAIETVERRVMDANFAVDRAAEALESATSAKARAQIALEIGQLELESQQLDLDGLVIRAPFDGVLLDFEPNIGDCVSEGALAAQVYAPDQKAVEVYVNIDSLVEAASVGVVIDNPVNAVRVNGETCSGMFTWIGTEANLETQYVKTTIDLNPECAPTLFLNEAVAIETLPKS